MRTLLIAALFAFGVTAAQAEVDNDRDAISGDTGGFTETAPTPAAPVAPAKPAAGTDFDFDGAPDTGTTATESPGGQN